MKKAAFVFCAFLFISISLYGGSDTESEEEGIEEEYSDWYNSTEEQKKRLIRMDEIFAAAEERKLEKCRENWEFLKERYRRENNKDNS